MAAKVSDNDCNGLYGVMKDVMEAAYNKGIERGKLMGKEEAERKAAQSCAGCPRCRHNGGETND